MTIIELLVGLVLLSIIVLGLSQIDLFSHTQVLRTDRQAFLENELSLILNRMDKAAIQVIGNEILNGQDNVVRWGNDGNSIDLRMQVDGNQDGKYQNLGNDPFITQDHAIAYQLGILGNHTLRYCPCCRNIDSCSNDNQCRDTGWEFLSNRITNFTISKPVNTSSQLNDNYVYIEMTACWDPDGDPDPCGSILNPQVTMHTVVNFPMVSVN